MGRAQDEMRETGFTDARFWDGVSERAPGYYLPGVLSDYKALEYSRLLDEWDLKRCGRMLVTDLYEAAFGLAGFYRQLAGMAEKLFCLDISGRICGRASKHIENAEIITGDARNIPFRGNCLDLILSPSTFDHFPEIELALAECFRTLRPGGRLVLALNSAMNPLFRPGVRLAERFKRKEYPTEYFYTKQQTTRLLGRAGFRAGRATAIMHVPLGATTVMEILDGLGIPFFRSVNKRLVRAFESWSKTTERMKTLTGWWVVLEGIKPFDGRLTS